MGDQMLIKTEQIKQDDAKFASDGVDLHCVSPFFPISELPERIEIPSYDYEFLASTVVVAKADDIIGQHTFVSRYSEATRPLVISESRTDLDLHIQGEYWETLLRGAMQIATQC